MLAHSEISSAFPYHSLYADILGSKMHYIDVGEGDPILFLHGMPASNYMWRNVIPYLTQHGRCIAPDLIGMGASDKPDIEYRVFDHIRYIDAFIEKLNLKNVTLVLHGWGSVIGFDYAMRHESNVKSLIFFESHLHPVEKNQELSLPIQELIIGLNAFDHGYNAIMNSDAFVRSLLRMGTMRRLGEDELKHYTAPYAHSRAYRPLIQYLIDYPYEHGVKEVMSLISNYSQKLKSSLIPKLMCYAMPGFNTTVDTIVWARDHLKNLTLEDIGDGLHFLPETQPHKIGQTMADWLS